LGAIKTFSPPNDPGISSACHDTFEEKAERTSKTACRTPITFPFRRRLSKQDRLADGDHLKKAKVLFKFQGSFPSPMAEEGDPRGSDFILQLPGVEVAVYKHPQAVDHVAINPDMRPM
jgi:hypothetical protein